MTKVIAVIGALDTKGEEFMFVKKEIEKRGHSALIINVGILKEPGLELNTRQTSLDASLRRMNEVHSDAYEELLLDVIEGDRSLFLRYDEVEYAWRVVDPVLNVWSTERDFIQAYPAGSWGPKESRHLFEKDFQHWRHSMDPE